MRRWLWIAVAMAGCDDGSRPTVAFDLDGPLAGHTYWDLPFPSDLRLTADGRPDLAGYPNERGTAVVTDILDAAAEHAGFPSMPVAYFRFTAAPPARSVADPIAADVSADVVLVDIDPESSERGRLAPIVAQTLIEDDFAMPFLFAVAPRPGIVLRPATTYAVVIRRSFAPGFAPPAGFADLAAGRTPAGARGAAAAALYQPLWPALDQIGIARDDVLVATVFTTGDEVAVLRARSEAARAAHDAVIDDLAIDPDDGDAHDGFCELVGTVRLPMFQVGIAPYDTGGNFEFDGSGAPIAQGEVVVPLVITLPARTMPATGWPLYQFFHGSGGLSSGVVDLGRTAAAGAEPEVGKGPGWVVARHGIAAASSALPVNPERLVNATDYAYLNVQNLGAFPYTFQQGVIEQRLLLDALLALEIAPSVVAGCAGIGLPGGATGHRFDATKLVAGGQSMGGMYTNMVGAVDDRYGALVPTGAGGYWTLMLFESQFVPGASGLLAAILATDAEQLRYVHPGLSVLEMAFDIAEPMASMSRLARRPLPGFPARHIYEPVGEGDEYFPTTIFDAAAIAYGNQQAGAEIWPGMQAALASDGLAGVATYPVSQNRTAADGTPYTGAVVQFQSDGIANAHYIYRQLDEVKHQYGCFLATWIADGTPSIPAPGPLGSPCE